MRLENGATNITGWTISDGSLGVDWQDAALGGASTGEVHDGSFAVDLCGSNPPGTFCSLSTVFPTSIGGSYQLSFFAYTGNQLNAASVSVGSLVNQAFTGAGPTSGPPAIFTMYTYNFIATSDSSTLTFQDTSSDGFGPVIDDVAVSAVPEPSSLALLAAGGLLMLRRRRQKASLSVI